MFGSDFGLKLRFGQKDVTLPIPKAFGTELLREGIVTRSSRFERARNVLETGNFALLTFPINVIAGLTRDLPFAQRIAVCNCQDLQYKQALISSLEPPSDTTPGLSQYPSRWLRNLAPCNPRINPGAIRPVVADATL